jgi:elongation factor Ts
VTEIGAGLVKELRELTGAGMMDCKRALQETGGDIEAARTLLREKGLASASKRADRATTEGLVGVLVDGRTGSIAGVGCETEPVSKNDGFHAFCEKVLRTLHADGVEALEALDAERLELMGKLGENIVVVGATRFDDGGTVAAYVHPPAHKIGVLVDLDGGTEELGRQLAMHISCRSRVTTRDDVPGRRSRPSARSTSTPTRCSRSRRARVRRSWTACSASASSRHRPAASSSTRRGSTMRRSRSDRPSRRPARP